MAPCTPNTKKCAGSWNSETTPRLGWIGTSIKTSTQHVGASPHPPPHTLLGHHLKTQDVSPLSLPDSPRIRACFTVEGDIVPPSHSKTSPWFCYHWNLHCTTCADRKPLETRLIPAAQVGLGYRHRSQLTISGWIGPSTRISTHPIR